MHVDPLNEELNLTPIRPYQLVEPFTGGGTVSLTAVAEKLVEQVILEFGMASPDS